jgi:hypothetical protein
LRFVLVASIVLPLILIAMARMLAGRGESAVAPPAPQAT